MRPTAAPSRFPYNHRTVEQVDRDHAQSRNWRAKQRAKLEQQRTFYV